MINGADTMRAIKRATAMPAPAPNLNAALALRKAYRWTPPYIKKKEKRKRSIRII